MLQFLWSYYGTINETAKHSTSPPNPQQMDNDNKPLINSKHQHHTISLNTSVNQTQEPSAVSSTKPSVSKISLNVFGMRRRHELLSKNKDNSSSHEDSHSSKGDESYRFVAMAFLTTTMMAAEIIVGLMSGSLTLLSDSLHMLSDLAALIVGYCAHQQSLKLLHQQREKNRKNKKFFAASDDFDPHNTIGYLRTEVVGALVNGIMLLTLSFTMIFEAIRRIISDDTHVTNVNDVLIVGCLGLVINFLGLFIFGHHGHHHGHDHGHDHDHGGHSHGHKHEHAGEHHHHHDHHGHDHNHNHKHKHKHKCNKTRKQKKSKRNISKQLDSHATQKNSHAEDSHNDDTHSDDDDDNIDDNGSKHDDDDASSGDSSSDLSSVGTGFNASPAEPEIVFDVTSIVEEHRHPPKIKYQAQLVKNVCLKLFFPTFLFLFILYYKGSLLCLYIVDELTNKSPCSFFVLFFCLVGNRKKQDKKTRQKNTIFFHGTLYFQLNK